MPYKIVKSEDKFCVHKMDEAGEVMGKPMGCHPDRAAAKKQMAALYASENKEIDDDTKEADLTKMYDEYGEKMMWVPPGVTTFAELDAYMESQEMAQEMRYATDHFGTIASNIMMSELVEDKAGALSALAKEFAGRVGKPDKMKELDSEDGNEPKETDDLDKAQLSAADETTLIDKAIAKFKELFGLEKKPEPQSENFSYIWKEADGQHHWLAAYTNNYRDNDNPPEIISSDAHKEFDQAVNSGAWPMPEVWLWHIPYKVGQAHYHAYDEKSGFCIAGGTIEGWAAEGVVKENWQGISHGMPRPEIRRDDIDKSIITRRRTREITFLPTQAAANNLAFHIISKETGMETEVKEIPAHKREEFVKAFGEERVKQMEAELAGRSQQAKDAGTESKEQTPAQTPATEHKPTLEPPSDVVEAIQALTAVVAENNSMLKSLDDRVKELERDDGERLAQKAASIPEASLAAYVKSQLFTRKNEVKDKGAGPQENKSEQDGSDGLFFQDLGWTSPVGRRS